MAFVRLIAIFYSSLTSRYAGDIDKEWSSFTHLKLENHLTSWAVLFLLKRMSGKYIFRTAELGYRTQKNISFALRRCIGVNVAECTGVKEFSDSVLIQFD